MTTIIHFPITNSIPDRIERTKDIITSLMLSKNSKILDIGGNDYKKYCQQKNYEYIMLDLNDKLKYGTGGYNKDPDGMTYDGKNIPFTEKIFDLVIVNFVLHHASHNTLFLLKQIRNISKKYVIIGEDLSELDYDIKWHERNHIHQPGGIFRSNDEWKELFKLYDFKLEKQYIIHRYDDINPTKIYRCMYLLY